MLDKEFELGNTIDLVAPAATRTRGRSFNMRPMPKKSQLQEYQLKETIGTGGFGKVKKGVHKLTGEKVAVKICCVDKSDRQNRESIEREINMHKKLMHENIAQIYEVIKKDNKIYIFMQYCKNGELFDHINSCGPIPEKESARIFNQILSALLYLKENGLSHRDVKPENILFDQNWNVKLIDFGFTCQVQTFRKTVCGTPSYTSPEIIRKMSYDAELADVWSLGVTLFAMLTASLPFEADSTERKKANILSFRWNNHPLLSHKAKRLFNSIFVDARQRVRLADLRDSQFSLSYEEARSNFIDFKRESLVVENVVMDVIDKNYNINSQKVAESVMNCRLDRFHAMYYLTLKNQKHTHRHISTQKYLNQFKKQKKSSLLKLEPISRTPTIPKKSTLIDDPIFALKTSRNLKSRDTRLRPRLLIDPNDCRLRKDSPDSPRRLLDCVGAYKEF